MNKEEPTQYEYEKYLTSKETIKKDGILDKYGVAIIPSILDDTECSNLVSGLWDYFEHVSSEWPVPIKRDDKTTWKGILELHPLHSMLFQHFGVGHCQAVWDVRQNQKIIEIFMKIWQQPLENLLVSFDGFSFGVPPEENNNKGWAERTRPWWHTDQSLQKRDNRCIQSWVTGLDVNEGDATLCVLEGSHNFHSEFGIHFKITENRDWYKIADEEQLKFFIDRGCTPVRIKCPKGSLVLWNSRTFHYGGNPIRSRSEPNFRAIAYLCYLPREWATEADLKKKRQAFDDLRTTSHWPHEPKLFPLKPRLYEGQKLPDNIKLIHRPVIDPKYMTLTGHGNVTYRSNNPNPKFAIKPKSKPKSNPKSIVNLLTSRKYNTKKLSIS